MHTLKFYAMIVILALIALGTLGFTHPEPDANSPSHAQVVFLVRHADTNPDAGRDPDLTVDGYLRANRLATMLADQTIDSIFVTDTKRSNQTAQPAADAMNIKPTLYPPMDADALANTIHGNKAITTTLIVAHSNTVPMILKALGGDEIDDLPHDEFGRLFVVILKDGDFVNTVALRY
jgi:phosphohistidine phosphatase SixA